MHVAIARWRCRFTMEIESARAEDNRVHGIKDNLFLTKINARFLTSSIKFISVS